MSEKMDNPIGTNLLTNGDFTAGGDSWEENVQLGEVQFTDGLCKMRNASVSQEITVRMGGRFRFSAKMRVAAGYGAKASVEALPSKEVATLYLDEEKGWSAESVDFYPMLSTTSLRVTLMEIKGIDGQLGASFDDISLEFPPGP